MKTCLKTRADVDYGEESDEDNGDEYKDSMKTLTKKRRKSEEEKNEKWMNMSKMKKLMFKDKIKG